jgi:hypothetical protein
MPRIASEVSIAQLEKILHSRRGQLAAINRKMQELSGGRMTGPDINAAGRARNAMSLVKTLSQILGESGKAMSVTDIVERVLASGYHSTSPNFRGIVNMTLIKERKRFANAGRGMYQLAEGRNSIK